MSQPALPPRAALLLPALLLSTLASAAPLLRETTESGTVQTSVDFTLMRAQKVKVDTQLLRSDNTALELRMFSDASFIARRDRIIPTDRDGFVWVGHLAGQEDHSAVILSILGNVVVGNITTAKGEVYQLRYLGNDVHSARQIDMSRFPDEAPPGEIKFEGLDPKPLGTPCTNDNSGTIDVMVVYTAPARSAAGGTEAMEALIYLAVEETNQSYLNSQITQRLRLVHRAEVSYTESGNAQTDRDRLRNPTDGFMDNVHALRDTYGADLVALIVQNAGAGLCGIAYIMDPVSTSFENYAFAVVASNCATGYYSFGHELGHIMSARHDAYVDPTNFSPYQYNHGYTYPAGAWRTVMGYNNACSAVSVNCTRIPYFSNPGVTYGGAATGVTNQSDNHLTLNNTANTVANFRCSSPGVNNVWMKDTWEDRGLEPDSNTASQAMWQSPYIWVRNFQDPQKLYQHMHQNPELGQPNYVYVKLHNGGNATSGTLNVYYANASTGLSWPANWTLIQSVPTSLTAHSSQVVEATWNNLPATGHYCMIARWVSASDPMTFTETTDIDYNTRRNNNIVWRNMNIVDLQDVDQVPVRFIFRGLVGQKLPYTLAIRPPREQLRDSFLTNGGRLTLRLNDLLFSAWAKGGMQGKGFERIDERTLVVTSPDGAQLDGITLGEKEEDSVELLFERGDKLPQRVFKIEAVQATKERELGGVAYEIHTDRYEGGAGGGEGRDLAR
jgi:hypothetical protein